jgi:hypothetical protein
MLSIHAVTLNNLVQIGVFIVILLVVWAIIKALFRVAMRLFLFGLGAILVLGVILAIMRWLGGG